MWIKQRHAKEWKSLTSHQFFNTAEVYLPALVIKKRDEGFFDIQIANLNGQTHWSLVLEKVLYRVPPLYYLFSRWKQKMACLIVLFKRLFQNSSGASQYLIMYSCVFTQFNI